MKSLLLIVLIFVPISGFSQQSDQVLDEITYDSEFTDRQAVIETIKNFYIGDHTGSIEHKKLSMHEEGAYRYVNRNGEYGESIFNLESDSADPNYQEELLSIEIYQNVALARLRLDQFRTDVPEYKLMILHKIQGEWKITTISWGFGVIH